MESKFAHAHSVATMVDRTSGLAADNV